MKNITPLVTIVMPAYNVENFISSSIESVLRQTYVNFELIIINDGSLDATPSIINKYAQIDSRIKVLSQNNSGVSLTRNKGLAEAKGDYISFLDADDIYDERYIEQMLKPLISGEADMTFCKYWETKSDIEIAKTPEAVKYLCNDSFIQHLLQVDKVHNMALMYCRKSLSIHHVTFLEGCPNGEDRMFILKAAYHLRVGFVPEYLYQYIYRDNSACRVELSYERLFLMLDGYLEMNRYFCENDRHFEKELYVKYVDKEIIGIKNDLRRKMWDDLGKGKHDCVESILNEYKQRYTSDFSIPYTGIKRFTMYPKMKIIKSKNRKLWNLLFFK